MAEPKGWIQFRISDVNRAGLERLRQKFPQFNLTAIGDIALRGGIAVLEGNPTPRDVASLRPVPQVAGEAAMALAMAGVASQQPAQVSAEAAAAQSPPALVVVPAAPVSVSPAPVAGPAALPAGKVRRVHMDMGVRSPAPAAGLGKGMEDPGPPVGP